MKEFLLQEFWGNTAGDYLIGIGILVLSVFIIQLLKKLIINRFDGPEEDDKFLSYNFLVKIISRFVIPLLYLGALYLAMQFIETNEKVTNILKFGYLLIAIWIVIKFAKSVMEFLITRYSRGEGREDNVKRFKPLLAFANFFFYVIGLLFILDNLGFEVATIIAGLGIGGIAIALAAQAILGDLFSYFVIYFDKPFELGDFVIFDDKLGVIERIGIKSTRIRTLRGELLVMSNSNLTSARLHNFKQMQRRRITFKIGVVYQTKGEQLEEIPKLIKQIIDDNELATFDRSHFFQYGDFSLDFETVYYVETNDYIKYMDVQHDINLKIYKEFEKREIQFAYPTRTVYNIPPEEIS